MTIKSKIGLSIHNANEELQKRCMDSALSIYGKPALPKEVSERLVLELSAIIANGYATCFQNHIQ